MFPSAILATCLALGLSLLIYRSMRVTGGVQWVLALKLVIAGAAVAVPIVLLTSYVIDSLGWSAEAGAGTATLASTLLVVAPIEQAALVIVVWPAYHVHRLLRIGTAVSAGLLSASGFGVVHLIERTTFASGQELVLPTLAVFSIRALATAFWASTLATSKARFRHFFPVAWLVATALDGWMRYRLRSAGAGWQLSILLALLALLVGSHLVGSKYASQRQAMSAIRQSRLGILVDPHGLGTVRASWQHAHRPALLHWIVGGAFVSFGANILGLGFGIALAHAFGIDLSRVDESNVGAMIPLLLLGATVLASYPLAAYLTAKASAADSVFEPGVAALISIVALTMLLSMTAPVTIILAIVLAPVAFGLSCLGAWLGLSPSSSRETP